MIHLWVLFIKDLNANMVIFNNLLHLQMSFSSMFKEVLSWKTMKKRSLLIR